MGGIHKVNRLPPIAAHIVPHRARVETEEPRRGELVALAGDAGMDGQAHARDVGEFALKPGVDGRIGHVGEPMAVDEECHARREGAGRGGMGAQLDARPGHLDLGRKERQMLHHRLLELPCGQPVERLLGQHGSATACGLGRSGQGGRRRRVQPALDVADRLCQPRKLTAELLLIGRQLLDRRTHRPKRPIDLLSRPKRRPKVSEGAVATPFLSHGLRLQRSCSLTSRTAAFRAADQSARRRQNPRRISHGANREPGCADTRRSRSCRAAPLARAIAPGR